MGCNVFRWFGVLATALLMVGMPMAGYGAPAGSPSQAIIDRIEARIIELTNEQRAKNGLKPLETVDYLHQAAFSHSSEMLQLKYFSHYSPTFARKDPKTRIAARGGWDTTTGENIFACSAVSPETIADRAVASWLRSPPHYKNMMNPQFNRIGVGVARVDDRYAITQDFSKQSIEVVKLKSSREAGGVNVVLCARVVEGSSEGALFVDNVAKGQFAADKTGYFEVSAKASERSTIAVAQKVAPTKFSTNLSFPADTGLAR